MNRIRRYIANFLTRNKKKQKFTDKDLEFASHISKLVGYPIQDVELYREAFSLKKIYKKGYQNKNYERLEFLGDAVLGSIISYYLFKNYPQRNEGYLTQMKSKIVNRKNLNELGDRLALTQYIQCPDKQLLSEDISGNLFEALVGAIYLDSNYKVCENVVMKWLLNSNEIEKIENKIVSYKSLLLEWSQKKKVKIEYNTIQCILPDKSISFKSDILIDNSKIANGSESSKKKAEEKASRRAFYILNKKENILENYKIIS